MRVPNERNLAVKVPEIDLILAGHDHIYHCEMVQDIFFLKSGTDFEDFSNLKVTINISEQEVREKYKDLSKSEQNVLSFQHENNLFRAFYSPLK